MEGAGVVDVPGIDSIPAQPHRAELLVTDGDGRGGAPALVGLEARGEEVHIALERILERLVPVHQVGQERKRLRVQSEQPGAKNIGDSAFIDERSRLRFADGQLAAGLDLLILHGETPGKSILVGFRPLDNIDKLLGNEIAQCHE